MKSVDKPSLGMRCVAEAIGTFILVFLGCGAVHAAVVAGAHQGLWQVAVVWGIAVALAVFIVGGVSGAHINPAITVALAAWGKFPKSETPQYIGAQVCGAFVAAAVLFAVYAPWLSAKEQEKHIERGKPGSELTAMCYGEFFPNPGAVGAEPGIYDRERHIDFNRRIGALGAFFAEFVGTMILALAVAALGDGRNSFSPQARLAPAFIGLTVAVLIAVIAPLTQACFNPARDFGPRMFAFVAGWRMTAFPPGAGFFTVYILAPICGSIVGMGLYEKILLPALLKTAPKDK